MSKAIKTFANAVLLPIVFFILLLESVCCCV